MLNIHLSAIGYVHGQPRSVSELDEKTSGELSPFIAEIQNYRATTADFWQLAVAAARRTLAGAAELPDLLIYVSENDPDTTGSLARILGELELVTVDHLSVSGHDCGNLGPALRMAGNALHAGACRRILLILADRALAGRRIMANGLSVFSDGAASCVLTKDVPDTTGPWFTVQTVVSKTQVQIGAVRAPEDAILATARLAKESVTEIVRITGNDIIEFRHVIFGNYRLSAQKFLAAAMGLPADKVLLGSVTDLGHCFSADTLVTLDQHRTADRLGAGDRVLAVTTGPYSWSTIVLQCD